MNISYYPAIRLEIIQIKSQNLVTQPGIHPHSMLITSIVEMTSLNESYTILGWLASISMFPTS